ncbi:MAG TPA: hypothetical protein VFZ17_15050, partial [Acidimicrobiia bacterium]|nr:hypothetical protein [Acidimicrobiia bacterium]
MTGHRIAVVTTEVVAPKMAGPAIRAWHMARVLAAGGHDVELLTTERCDRRSESFRCAHASVAELDVLGGRC